MEKPRYSLSFRNSQIPTIFLHATGPDNFRYLVQKYTGTPTAASSSSSSSSSSRPAIAPRRPAFKLQERRPSAGKKLYVTVDQYYDPSPGWDQASAPGGWNNNSNLSPVTPLDAGALFSPTHETTDEERVIADKGFYLHPSPSRQWAEPPKLLQLFPLTPSKLSSHVSNDSKGACKVERA